MRNNPYEFEGPDRGTLTEPRDGQEAECKEHIRTVAAKIRAKHIRERRDGLFALEQLIAGRWQVVAADLPLWEARERLDAIERRPDYLPETWRVVAQ